MNLVKIQDAIRVELLNAERELSRIQSKLLAQQFGSPAYCAELQQNLAKLYTISASHRVFSQAGEASVEEGRLRIFLDALNRQVMARVTIGVDAADKLTSCELAAKGLAFAALTRISKEA